MNNVTILKFVKDIVLPTSSANDFTPWGDDNKFPELLMKLYESVPEHSAACDFVETLVVGQGLNSATFDYWTIKKIVFDYIMYGGYAIQVVKLRNGSIKYEYLDVANLRYSKDKTKFVYSENWGEYKTKIVSYEISDGKTTGVWLFKNNKSKKIYPKPYYMSSTLSLDTLYKVIKYHNNNATNGFTGNVIINIPGIPDEDDQAEIEKGFAEKFTGEDGQKFILNFSNTVDDAATVQTIGATNLDEKFKDLQVFLRDEIIIGHKLTSPNLVGVSTSGNGFNKTEYQESLEIFKENIIEGYRNELTYSIMQLTGEQDIKFLDKEQKENISVNKEIITE